MAIRLEQQTQATINAVAAGSVDFTLTTAPTNGNLLVCVWEMNDTGPTMAGTGVTWTRQNVFAGDASHDNIALFTGVVGPGASITQTMTQSISKANAAGILLEFSGVQQVVDGTPPTPTNLSSATPSITSNKPAFPADLVVAFMGNVANSTPTATPAGWQTVTAATNTRRLDGAYNLTSTSPAAISAQWSYSGSQFALAEIILIKAAPQGTTTSTSSTSTSSTSTSATTFSTSSTSASTSSTSISSTSTSFSTSSTSVSTSSTSSSISSTSSSISSTSISSTSSSTSTSSTSSSISSTSTSSTSTSSTSSSTSRSSTSTSFSSTSSSISSTSASTSSTSVSSTSSSSSTSTTAIPLNLDYSYQDSLTLSATSVDGTDIDLSKNYQNVGVNDSDYFVQYGSEYLIQEFKKTWINNTDNPNFTYKGRSTYDTRVSPILIQIFNVNSATWETLANINFLPADTDFTQTVTQSANISNYYSSSNVVTFRIYQQVI